ncbi:2,3,4,5-tetrahydropyridine-2,6-dicarboxylate N-acetyltransferase [Clostridium sp. MSJ-11]|uniref:2,3,4,5-tetrahydropyridine-2,6-dicarboxylate N-acetyltransferase n=1 Tax=Clostridium mobile TaxID=2841512 RepID=A0ABS6EJR8_9CLOT|nr:2,3,4,5-tetrahydropyridine-2,6-dicarboxylate N-acetyltransferase [Clostridium mobile]MBU5485453.1 2,3,4,5-tetrahydropyridine-2,6-dicarboxylate N-acetyltransferase [Clostridium mobile]
MKYDFNDPYKLAEYIKDVKKSTPVKAYINGNLNGLELDNIEAYGENNFFILFGQKEDILKFIDKYRDNIKNFRLECDRKNSAVPLMDIINVDARIEPGAIIRDKVKIGKHAVIMMGAVINIGAEIGDYTMVDMNAVVGARGKLGKRVHLGAGAVVAGVLEPPSKDPCTIEDNVMVGANAVILEGVRIGEGAVIAAGSVVVGDVPPRVVVAGAPAKVIKHVDKKTESKTKILDDLRK